MSKRHRKFAAWLAVLLPLTCGLETLAAETLQDALTAAKVPTAQFSASELSEEIWSDGIPKGDPILLAYYVDDGTGGLPPLLHIIRYDRATGSLHRAELRDTDTPPLGREFLRNCFGSILRIREYRGTIYIDTHINPSAGCVFVLSPRLEFKAALGGGVIGLLGDEYAVLRRSEMHFTSVFPLHVEIYDLKLNQLVEVYPYKGDAQRRRFSTLLKPHLSRKWCAERNIPCDPEKFDTYLGGNDGMVVLNEAAKTFGFEARFDDPFSAKGRARVPTRNVAYFFRERGGIWEHREFSMSQFKRLFPGMSVQKLVSKNPNLVFSNADGK